VPPALIEGVRDVLVGTKKPDVIFADGGKRQGQGEERQRSHLRRRRQGRQRQ
jgi:hypothetical protein